MDRDTSCHKHQFIFILGTEAELIKVFPIWWEGKNDYEFLFLISGQTNLDGSFFYEKLIAHGAKVEKICGFVKLGFFADTLLFRVLAFGLWSVKFFFALLIPLLKKRFQRKPVILVHGDTVTTLIASITAKILLIKLWHVESCLRSAFLFSPFPEEICRRIVSRISDIRFCSNEEAYKRSYKIAKTGNIHTVNNTVCDAINLIGALKSSTTNYEFPPEPYCLLLVHRQENLFGDIGRQIIRSVGKNLDGFKCIFICHDTTLQYLEDKKFLDEVRRFKNMEVRKRLAFDEFIHLLAQSEFLLTDSGTNQEECAYLNVPCGLLRDTTERQEGLDKNVFITMRQSKRIKFFIDNYKDFVSTDCNSVTSATSIILRHFRHYTSK